MQMSNEMKNIIMQAVQAKSHGGGTEAQQALAYAVTHGENSAEVLARLVDDVRG